VQLPESGMVIKIAEVGGYLIDMSEKRHDEVIEYMVRWSFGE
jgi:hypothetical protein